MSVVITWMVLISKSVAVQISRRQHVCVDSSEIIAIFSDISAFQHEFSILSTFGGSREHAVFFLCGSMQGFTSYGARVGTVDIDVGKV